MCIGNSFNGNFDIVGLASKMLLEAAKDLVIESRSSLAKNRLLEATKGILSGTTNVLRAFDGFEIRRIVKVVQLCMSAIEAIKATTY